MDESKVEGLHYGHTEWGMVPCSWTGMWDLMLGDADASGISVLMHWVIKGGFG